MQNDVVLKMRGIVKQFPGTRALDNVDFTLRKGEVHALMGENGAGKSTLIKVLTGVYEKDAGSIWVEGSEGEAHIHSPQDAQNIGISTVYQEITLCPNLTVAENMFIGRTSGSVVPWKEYEKRADEILGNLGIPARAKQELSRCSLAVQQMIAIARERSSELRYEAGDMTAFAVDDRFDLVTCTGDALNHVTELGDVRKVFACVHDALNPGGLFVFDLLRADEVPEGEPFWADFTDDMRVCFSAERDDMGFTTLRIDAFEGDMPKFSEVIREKTHDVGTICDLLRKSGFDLLQCADRLLMDSEVHGATWFIVARRAA